MLIERILNLLGHLGVFKIQRLVLLESSLWRCRVITVITLTAPLSPSGRLRCLKVPEEDSIIVHVRIRRLGESIWSKGPFVFLIDSVQNTLELDWLGCQILVEESEIARGVCGKVDVYLEIS